MNKIKTCVTTVNAFFWMLGGNAVFERYQKDLGGWTFQTRNGYYSYSSLGKVLREAYIYSRYTK